MKRLCVIGDPVAHSLSPAIHSCLFEHSGLAGSYEAHTVRKQELASFVEEAKRGAWDGCNVTMPHKKAILPLLDECTEEAVACGAVNTVRFEKGRAVGHNTDGQGFVRSLAESGFRLPGASVLLVGAGGAAEAVLSALVRDGASQVVLCNRSMAKAEQLADQYGMTVKAIPFTEKTLFAEAAAADLLVNATPLGMAGNAQWPDFSFLDDCHAAVYDLVYYPQRTQLLQQAHLRGLQTIGGTELLVFQAMEAFAFFTGAVLHPTEMRQVIMENICIR